MALTIADIIEARRPGTPIDARTTALIELAENQTDAAAFDHLYNHAVALLVCHWLEKSDSMDAGQITGKREGQLSLTYAKFLTGIGSDDALASTVYGQEYLSLRDTIFSPMVRGMNEMPKVERDYP